MKSSALFKKLSIVFRSIRHVLTVRPMVATEWGSMVDAASEEWVDKTIFRFTVELPQGVSCDALVAFILEKARGEPDLKLLLTQLAAQFQITEKQALTTIDRALGGVARAAALNPAACPDVSIDPVGCSAFIQASKDHSIIDAVYPTWRSWKPGCHSISQPIPGKT
jgi:hypothetical protein